MSPDDATQPSTHEQRQRYRQTIGHFATGVSIITSHGANGPVGMTANALCSVSLDPLLLLVCFDQSARTLPVVQDSGRFAVNVLRHEQHALSGTFASKLQEQEKFAGVPWRLHEGAPILDQALAWLICSLRDTHPAGDHTIGIGEVIDSHHEPAGRPLVWFGGSYGRLADETPAEARLPN
ncbi:MAG TPA: flavin reductase family protein [Solirubrobacteraceae bacterium]|nr:flavin reductase family protein [Solirubrobacteraceae bacterium]